MTQQQDEAVAELMKLESRIAKLMEQRARELFQVKDRYRLELDKLRQRRQEAYRKLRSPKLTMLEKYTEPDDAEPRFCKTCGLQLLRANLQNAQLILNTMKQFDPNENAWGNPATPYDVRHMTKPHCCFACSRQKEYHSLWCSREERIAEAAELANENAHED